MRLETLSSTRRFSVPRRSRDLPKGVVGGRPAPFQGHERADKNVGAPRRRRAAALTVRLLALLALRTHAQLNLPGNVTIRNFSISPGWFDPPHEQQMRSLLKGKEAQSSPDGRFRVIEAELQSFREYGDPEMRIETPEFLYD